MEHVDILHNVMIPMRDGIHLATDIYLPKDRASDATFFALLERIPYNKCGTNAADRSAAAPTPVSKPTVAAAFALAGYVYVIQDCRGRYKSEGSFTKYLSEGDDGADTLAWIRAQQWSNGTVGTLGLSYAGHVQTALAALAPVGLGAMLVDSGGFASAFHSGIRQGGAFEGKQLTWAVKHARLAQATQDDPIRKAALDAAAAQLTTWMTRTPWTEAQSPLAAAPEYEQFILDQWRQETFSAFWTHPSLCARLHYTHFPVVPIALVCSWFDPYAATAVENFEGLKGRGASTRLLLGPWTHGQRSVTYSGDVDFGPHATLDSNVAPDYHAFRTAWFDEAFGKPSLFDTFMPSPVKLFVMGGGSGRRTAAGRLDHGGHWRDEADWPLARTRWTPCYLTTHGLMQTTMPSEQTTARSFEYDPRDPVATHGGATASGAPLMKAGAFDQGPENVKGLTFETVPFETPVEVTGRVRAHLFVSSSALDTDFTVKLMDVYPPSDEYPLGFAMNLSHGILRMRFRDGFDAPVWITSGDVYEIEIEMYPTSNVFAAGHTLRLDISSSNFPHFDLNFNTTAPAGVPSTPVVARNSVHMGLAHPSHVLLPIVPSQE
ncbi:Aste57867_22001 [Aphanomyces stellatus]|uniref:Aste57867_22001 protein n=1 Tax=Aphanomyces stellatus TaxID=120398 RepID=A0A485LJP4_9STRA|nr:hypothetical protein As57867_021932 [Aphanomyces stellatus]VFT98669.1 Aste57867_22001 [Aphanomyces stellatus]